MNTYDHSWPNMELGRMLSLSTWLPQTLGFSWPGKGGELSTQEIDNLIPISSGKKKPSKLSSLSPLQAVHPRAYSSVPRELLGASTGLTRTPLLSHTLGGKPAAQRLFLPCREESRGQTYLSAASVLPDCDLVCGWRLHYCLRSAWQLIDTDMLSGGKESRQLQGPPRIALPPFSLKCQVGLFMYP